MTEAVLNIKQWGKRPGVRLPAAEALAEGMLLVTGEAFVCQHQESVLAV